MPEDAWRVALSVTVPRTRHRARDQPDKATNALTLITAHAHAVRPLDQLHPPAARPVHRRSKTGTDRSPAKPARRHEPLSPQEATALLAIF